jgi:hypothetical protein
MGVGYHVSFDAGIDYFSGPVEQEFEADSRRTSREAV